MEKTLSYYEPLFTTSFPVISEALLFVFFLFLVEMLCTSLSFFLQDSNNLHCLRSLVHHYSNDDFVHQHCAFNQQEQTQETVWVSDHWASLRDVQVKGDDVVRESTRFFAV